MVSRPPFILAGALFLLFTAIFILLAAIFPVDIAENPSSQKIQEEKTLPRPESGLPLGAHTFPGSGSGAMNPVPESKTLSQAVNSPAKVESKPLAESEYDHIVKQVRAAAITYDPASLSLISPYLNSPDLELREEAVNAVVTLGDAAGAPLLRSQAEKEIDPFHFHYFSF